MHKCETDNVDIEIYLNLMQKMFTRQLENALLMKVHYHSGWVVTATNTAKTVAVTGHRFKMKVTMHDAVHWRELCLGQLLQGLDSASNSLISLKFRA